MGHTTPEDPPAEICFKKSEGTVNNKMESVPVSAAATNSVSGAATNSVTSDASNDFLPLRSSLPTGTTTTSPSTHDDSVTRPSIITLDSIKYHTLPVVNVEFQDKNKNRDRLFCCGCHNFMMKPWVITECGHNICLQCKDSALAKGTGICPAIEDGHPCDTPFDRGEVREDKGLLRDMKSIKINCPNKTEGCEEVMSIPSIEAHLRECPATKPKLPSLEDVETDLLSKLSDPTRQMTQETSGPTISQFMALITSVKALTIKIQGLEDENKTLKQNVTEFQAEFNAQKERCDKLEEENRNKEREMNELKSRLESSEQKIRTIEQQAPTQKKTEGGVSVAQHGQMQGQLKKLSQQTSLHDITLNELDVRMQCVESATYDGKMVWKISQFSEHMDRAKKGQTLSLFSQPFYAGSRGYKMCGRVYLNGDGAGKGSWISFFFVLMRGTYDDLLPWPFKQKITLGVKDVNNDGASDIRESFNPSAKSQSFKKPVSEMNVASGCPQFLKHIDMRKYIKSDTIYLYLEVDMVGLESVRH